MLNSMTGYGNSQADISSLGKVSFELRSVNHRFLDIVCHLPVGLPYLEDKIKKEIAKKIKRGRVVCLLNILAKPRENFLINRQLLKEYYFALNKLISQLNIKQPLALDTLIHLPGVLTVKEDINHNDKNWSRLKPLLRLALAGLTKTRAKEGQALYMDLKQRNQELKANLVFIRKRFKKVIKERLMRITVPEEQTSFIKSSDITEEIVRIQFHTNNFIRKLKKSGAVGKELDFISQELTRECNTIGAKSIDAIISSNVITMKSQIEKIREQLQNVE